MSEQRFDLDIRDALLAGPQRAPSAMVDAALAQALAGRQRRPLARVLDGRAWPPSAIPAGDRRLRVALQVVLVVALLAAAVSTAVLVGGSLLDRWTPFPPRETSLARAGTLAHRLDRPIAVPLDDGRVLVAGYAEDSVAAVVFDPRSGASLPLDTRLAAPVLVSSAVKLADGRVFLLAWESRNPVPTGRSFAFMFDPRSNGLSAPVETLEQRFVSIVAVLADGRVFVFGGVDNPEVPALVIRSELFDPAAGTFTPGPLTQAVREGDLATALPSGEVLLVHDRRDSATDAQAQILDPSTGQVRDVAMPEERPTMLGRAGRHLVPLPGSRILVIGIQVEPQRCGLHGIDEVGASIYDPGIGAITRVANIPHQARAATALPDGRVVLAGEWQAIPGGCGASGGEYVTGRWVGVFDPATGGTIETRNPITGEGGIPGERDVAFGAAAVLRDGRVVLVSEGQDGPNMIDILEVGQ